ncbi:type III-B CRISPR module-associated protein Cmr3 [Oryzibacter oryziterrae]|uniref:type III-B CRISPR module-associated protein Cmr3 n=1 Tax=Oryzibacter oryziterrae TaxID=2766474 RepID=UPI001F310EF4|nr:type III-B CRISPR module-associated protein Cmr3 [Oryzibacter oryziterrae]
MSEQLLTLDAYDTLWFRDGRPFDQMDEGLAEARSVFPPSPSTLAGAIASILAPLIGDESRESDHFAPRLRLISEGDESMSGQITMVGPFLVDDSGNLFVPAPATLIAPRIERLSALGISHAKYITDRQRLGILLPRSDLFADAQLLPFPIAINPKGDLSKYESLASMGYWVREKDFAAHMMDMMPRNLFVPRSSEAFHREQRIGIGVTAATRTATDGQLFAAQHLRPEDRGNGRMRLAMIVSDPLELVGNTLAERIAVIGGKGRFARIDLKNIDLAALFSTPEMRPWREKTGRIYFRLTAMTPVPVHAASQLGLQLPTAAIAEILPDFRVHSVVMPRRPTPTGIWNSVGKSKMRVVQCHSAGTTWFASCLKMDGDAVSQVNAIREAFVASQHVPVGMADLGAMGFGKLIAGEWPDFAELQSRVKKELI